MKSNLFTNTKGLSLGNLLGRALVAVVFSAACLALPVAPALAGGWDAGTPTVAVGYVPARLGQAGYADELYARLEDAAGQVCKQSAGIAEKVTPRGDRMIFIQRPEAYIDQCMEESVTRAVTDVGSPALDAVHEQTRKGVVRIAATR